MDSELELATDVTMPAAQVARQFGHVSSVPICKLGAVQQSSTADQAVY